MSGAIQCCKGHYRVCVCVCVPGTFRSMTAHSAGTVLRATSTSITPKSPFKPQMWPEMVGRPLCSWA